MPASVLPTLLRAHLHIIHKQYNFNLKWDLHSDYIHLYRSLNFFSTLLVWAMLEHGISLNTIYKISGSSFLFSERKGELLYSACFQSHFKRGSCSPDILSTIIKSILHFLNIGSCKQRLNHVHDNTTAKVVQWAYMLAGKGPGRCHFLYRYSYNLYRSCGKVNMLHKRNIWIIRQGLFQALLNVVVFTVVKIDFIILLRVVKGTSPILGNTTSLF